jgi:Tfp pilus assembly protein PilN
MHQQINLYQPVFRKQEKVFGAATLLKIGAAALLLLLGILVHAWWTLAGMQNTALALEQQMEGLGRKLTVLEAGNRTPDSDGLDSDIARLQTAIQQRHALLGQFEQLATQHENGFAARFEALARQQVPGLWLEGVTVDSDNRIELRGLTLDARLVPLYVQQLASLGDLSDRPFETISMTRLDSGAPQLQFVLRNFKGDATWHLP